MSIGRWDSAGVLGDALGDADRKTEEARSITPGLSISSGRTRTYNQVVNSHLLYH